MGVKDAGKRTRQFCSALKHVLVLLLPVQCNPRCPRDTCPHVPSRKPPLAELIEMIALSHGLLKIFFLYSYFSLGEASKLGSSGLAGGRERDRISRVSKGESCSQRLYFPLWVFSVFVLTWYRFCNADRDFTWLVFEIYFIALLVKIK